MLLFVLSLSNQQLKASQLLQSQRKAQITTVATYSRRYGSPMVHIHVHVALWKI